MPNPVSSVRTTTTGVDKPNEPIAHLVIASALQEPEVPGSIPGSVQMEEKLS